MEQEDGKTGRKINDLLVFRSSCGPPPAQLGHHQGARRAVSDLRWHEEDVDDIVPSLFANRKGARKGKAVEPGAEDSPPEAEEV